MTSRRYHSILTIKRYNWLAVKRHETLSSKNIFFLYVKTYLFNALKFSTLYKEVTTNWKSLFTPDKFSTLILIYKEDGESQTLANLSKKTRKRYFLQLMER